MGVIGWLLLGLIAGAIAKTDGEPESGRRLGSTAWRSWRSGSRYDACGDISPIT
jgi:hypothetical protein